MPNLSFALLPNNLTYNKGESVQITVTENITHPVSVVSEYEWRDHNDNVVGTTKDLNYTFATDQDVALLLTATYTGTDYLVTLYQDVTFKVNAILNRVSVFTNKFNVTLKAMQQSNMDMMRIPSYFPKWSSANKNYVSKVAKFSEPFNSFISNCLYDINNIIVSNIAHIVPFEFLDTVYHKFVVNVPSRVMTEFGWLENIGPVRNSSILNYPITHVIQEESPIYMETFNHNKDTLQDLIYLKKPAILYIKAVEVVVEPSPIIIYGISPSGEQINEIIRVESNKIYSTNLEYKIVHKIESLFDLELKTYINCAMNHEYSLPTTDLIKIADKGGAIFDPIARLDGNRLDIIKQDGLKEESQHSFNIEAANSVFVSHNLDVLALVNNKLKSGKLHLPVELNLPINSSYNNNNVVYCSTEEYVVGDQVVFNVNVKQIKNIAQSTNIQVAIIHNGATTYVTPSIGTTTSPDTWIDVSSRNNNITFSVTATDTNPIIVQVHIYGFLAYFCAGTISNNIELIELCDAEELYIFRNQLYIKNNDVAYRLTPIRGCFVYDDNGIYTSYNFSTAELIYD